MKTEKFMVLKRVLGIVFLAVIWVSCDVMNADPDFKKPVVNVKNQDVYAISNGSVQIDLSTRIQTTQAVTLSITTAPRAGSLTTLGNGVVLYTSTAGPAHDSFKFILFDQNHIALLQDSINIVVANSTQLPCGIYAVTDHATLTPYLQGINIDVLLNDFICNLDSADIKLEIFHGDSISGPRFGVATVMRPDNHPYIFYIPNAPYPGDDKFLYKISSRSMPSRFGIGTVIISKTNSLCDFSVVSDQYTLRLDTTTATKFFFDIYGNDNLCASQYTFDISEAPSAGSATTNAAGLLYTPAALGKGETRTDSLRYEVCQISGPCKTALVYFTVKN